MKRRNDPAAWPLRLHYHVSNVTVSMLLMLYLFMLLMLRQGAIAGTLFALVMTGLLCIRPVNELLECKRQRDAYREILQNGQAFSGRVVDVRQRPHYTRELEEGENIRFGGSRHNPNSGVSARQVLDVWREGYEYILVIRLENQTVIESEPYLEPGQPNGDGVPGRLRKPMGGDGPVADQPGPQPAHSAARYLAAVPPDGTRPGGKTPAVAGDDLRRQRVGAGASALGPMGGTVKNSCSKAKKGRQICRKLL